MSDFDDLVTPEFHPIISCSKEYIAMNMSLVDKYVNS